MSKPSKHFKTPRSVKYKVQNKHLKYKKFVDNTKKKHFDNFLKWAKNTVEGCNIQFEPGEKKAIMRRYVSEFASKQTGENSHADNKSFSVTDSTKEINMSSSKQNDKSLNDQDR